MDTNTIKLFHEFYFPLIDLIIKISIGVGVAFILSKKGFKYKIKEKLYDNYMELTKLISEGAVLRTAVMKKIIIQDIYILNHTDLEWQQQFSNLLEETGGDEVFEKMSSHIGKISVVIEQISLYTTNNTIYDDFTKLRRYFHPLPEFLEINEELDEYLNDVQKKFLRNYKDSLNPEQIDWVRLKAGLNSFIDMVTSHINFLLVKKDARYHPKVFLVNIKKMIASF